MVFHSLRSRKALKAASAAFGATLLASAGTARTAPAPFAPVFKTDFADPFVLPHKGQYLAFATNATGLRANVQMARSPDLVRWSLITKEGRLHDAMPTLPDWAEPGRTWAPEVMRVGERFVLYFTARERRNGLQCVGIATAPDPLGPFVPVGREPLVCQRDLGGTIDPSPFRDRDGQLYLYFKNDGNNPAVLKPSRIWAQRLSEDGLSLTGPATPLIRNELHWEWRVVESPTMTRAADGTYVLFFSANHFGWEADQRLSNYGIGYATCRGPEGPCVKAPGNPILKSYFGKERGCLSGPGHQMVFEDRGQQHFVFHAWSATPSCRPANKGRYMYIAPLTWGDGKPVIDTSPR